MGVSCLGHSSLSSVATPVPESLLYSPANLSFGNFRLLSVFQIPGSENPKPLPGFQSLRPALTSLTASGSALQQIKAVPVTRQASCASSLQTCCALPGKEFPAAGTCNSPPTGAWPLLLFTGKPKVHACPLFLSCSPCSMLGPFLINCPASKRVSK